MKHLTIPCLCMALFFTQACKPTTQPEEKPTPKPTKKICDKTCKSTPKKACSSESSEKKCSKKTTATKEATVTNSDLKKDVIAAGIGPCVSGDSAPKVSKNGKVLWADSVIWTEAPKFQVEKWLSDKPDLKRKYVLVEFWNTWCPPCRRSLTLLNYLHAKYKDELAVIAVCDENEEAVRKCMSEGHKITCYNAIDTKAVMKKALAVRGVPHAIIYEPTSRTVIWEGFPLLKGYELTEKKIEKILAIGRKEGIIGKAK